MPTQANQTGFIAAIQMNGAWDADRVDSNTSAHPPAFTVQYYARGEGGCVSAGPCGGPVTVTVNAAGDVLAPGDIAFLGVNAEGSTDDFSFILLRSISAGTEINFTDCGWDDATGFICGGFAGGLGIGYFSWRATRALPCGSIVRISTFNGLSAPAPSTGAITDPEARTIANGNKAANFFFKPQPYWLKLVRQGNWFYGYYSFNGANFFYVTAQQIPMTACLDIGLTAFTNIPGSPATAVFSHVTAGGGGMNLVVLPGNTVEPGTVGRNISLFPNPTRDVVTLEFGQNPVSTEGFDTRSELEFGATLRLRNDLGQLIETRQLDPGTERLDWDVSRLNPGLYFIEVQEEGQAPQMLRFVRAE